MANWFECKVKYDTIDEKSGKDKTVSETYLLDALSFTEAESRIHKEMESLISGEFEVAKISKTKIEEIYNYEEAETWYKCKVIYVDVDEKSGKEKKNGFIMMCTADTLKEACEKVEEQHKDVLVPWYISAIQETNIVDIFPYFKGDDEVDDSDKRIDGISDPTEH